LYEAPPEYCKGGYCLGRWRSAAASKPWAHRFRIHGSQRPLDQSAGCPNLVRTSTNTAAALLHAKGRLPLAGWAGPGRQRAWLARQVKGAAHPSGEGRGHRFCSHGEAMAWRPSGELAVVLMAGHTHQAFRAGRPRGPRSHSPSSAGGGRPRGGRPRRACGCHSRWLRSWVGHPWSWAPRPRNRSWV
jgi:hypothetical protein